MAEKDEAAFCEFTTKSIRLGRCYTQEQENLSTEEKQLFTEAFNGVMKLLISNGLIGATKALLFPVRTSFF